MHILLFWLGRRRCGASAPAASARRPPRLWTLRLMALVTAGAFLALGWGAPKLIPVPAFAVLLIVGITAVGYWRVRAWSRRPGWGIRHELALASGAIGFLLLLAPVFEFANPGGKPTQGATLVALLVLVALVWLARRAAAVGRQEWLSIRGTRGREP